jgi:hypothetical protein
MARDLVKYVHKGTRVPLNTQRIKESQVAAASGQAASNLSRIVCHHRVQRLEPVQHKCGQQCEGSSKCLSDSAECVEQRIFHSVYSTRSLLRIGRSLPIHKEGNQSLLQSISCCVSQRCDLRDLRDKFVWKWSNQSKIGIGISDARNIRN